MTVNKVSTVSTTAPFDPYQQVTILGRVYTASCFGDGDGVLAGGAIDNPNSGQGSDFLDVVLAAVDQHYDVVCEHAGVRPSLARVGAAIPEVARIDDNLTMSFNGIRITEDAPQTQRDLDALVAVVDFHLRDAAWLRSIVAQAVGVAAGL